MEGELRYLVGHACTDSRSHPPCPGGCFRCGHAHARVRRAPLRRWCPSVHDGPRGSRAPVDDGLSGPDRSQVWVAVAAGFACCRPGPPARSAHDAEQSRARCGGLSCRGRTARCARSGVRPDIGALRIGHGLGDGRDDLDQCRWLVRHDDGNARAGHHHHGPAPGPWRAGAVAAGRQAPAGAALPAPSAFLRSPPDARTPQRARIAALPEVGRVRSARPSGGFPSHRPGLVAPVTRSSVQDLCTCNAFARATPSPAVAVLSHRSAPSDRPCRRLRDPTRRKQPCEQHHRGAHARPESGKTDRPETD
jgi:hypothetical protein